MIKNSYFASPLFSEMELRYNQQLVQQIRAAYPQLELYVPQEQMEINDKNAYADSKAIAQYDTKALLNSQLMIAVLDGAIKGNKIDVHFSSVAECLQWGRRTVTIKILD